MSAAMSEFSTALRGATEPCEGRKSGGSIPTAVTAHESETIRELLGIFANVLGVIELAEESRLTMRNLRASTLFENAKIALARARALHGGANGAEQASGMEAR